MFFVEGEEKGARGPKRIQGRKSENKGQMKKKKGGKMMNDEPGANPSGSGESARPVHETACRVTYRMTDQMGVVYYANYLELLEIGRTELLRDSGLTYRQMEQDGFLLPVIRVECDYRAPARYDDLLTIRTRLARLGRVRIDFTYEIVRPADGVLICQGLTHHAIVDAAGRPRRLSPEWMERLERKP